MNHKIKKLATNWRIIILLIFIGLSLVAIHPTLNKGAAIRSVATNSSASIAGIAQPKPNIQPVSRERIIFINNNMPVNTADDYYKYISSLSPNKTIQIKTSQGTYRLIAQEAFETVQLNETEEKIISETAEKNITVNGTIETINETITKKITVPKTTQASRGIQDFGLRVYDAPVTNIRKGLDLQGGTRVVLQPEAKLNSYDLSVLIDNMKERLNVYGLSDIVVRDAGDLSGNQYIVVEIAGATEEEIKDLLAKQGKFEAKIGNKTVFRGGNDIVYVGRSANEAGIDPGSGCSPSGSQWFCRFRFSITMSQAAAARQADATKDLGVAYDSSGRNDYLSQKLELFLDDKKVDELNIASDLKGHAVTQISISGSGIGANQQQAIFDALQNMKRLQTILITGSLPVKLNIVKIDAVSPVLGNQFIKNAIYMSLLAILSVAIVIAARYRKLIIAVPILITMLSEVAILLGVAAFIGWNIDLAAIAGILVAIGTGVDDQIVITDETLKGEASNVYNWKEKVRRAFVIIMLAYATVVVAMIPLIFAGAGLLKGFAITTIIGVTIGVFITRPAYSAFVEVMLK